MSQHDKWLPNMAWVWLDQNLQQQCPQCDIKIQDVDFKLGKDVATSFCSDSHKKNC